MRVDVRSGRNIFVLLLNSVVPDPGFVFVPDAAQCKKAVVNGAGEWAGEVGNPNMPPGCFVADNKRHFNKDPKGKPNPAAVVVYMEAAAAAKEASAAKERSDKAAKNKQEQAAKKKETGDKAQQVRGRII